MSEQQNLTSSLNSVSVQVEASILATFISYIPQLSQLPSSNVPTPANAIPSSPRETTEFLSQTGTGLSVSIISTSVSINELFPHASVAVYLIQTLGKPVMTLFIL
jgi:hypothetical protein